MEMRTRLGLLVAALTCMAAAPAAAQAKLPAGVTPAMIAKGKTIFTSTGLCFACHGMDAKGMVGPNLTDQTWIHGKGTYPEIVQIVTTGIPVAEDQARQGRDAPEGRLADQRGRREGSRRLRLVAEQPDLKHRLFEPRREPERAPVLYFISMSFTAHIGLTNNKLRWPSVSLRLSPARPALIFAPASALPASISARSRLGTSQHTPDTSRLAPGARQ